MKKKYERLGLIDPEVAKTSLLCKRIVKAMELGESNLQLMLRYRLVRFNPKKGSSWRVSIVWLTNKEHQGVVGSKVWGHIGNAWKIMVEGIFQLPPRMRMELLHANIWWSEGLDLLNQGFTYSKGLTLYHKGIQCVDDVWDQAMLINKLAEKWRPMLEKDSDTTYVG